MCLRERRDESRGSHVQEGGEERGEPGEEREDPRTPKNLLFLSSRRDGNSFS